MNPTFRGGFVCWLIAGVLVALAGGSARADDPPEAAAFLKATVDGKYSKLLAVISVPSDKKDYGEFNDYGISEGGDWAGYKGLPKGYWVYVAPNWYIWEKTGKG